MATSTARRIRGAFTIIEVMVVMGVVMVLIALSLPALAKMKERSRTVQSLSRIRQLGMLVLQYAGDNDDRVPTIFPAEFIEPGDPPECTLEVEVGGRTIRGSWFANSDEGFYAMTPPPVPGMMRAPSSPDYSPMILDGEPTSRFTDYEIAECYYATPNYWHMETQRGPEQWAAQAMSDTRYPSDKGFIYQTYVYNPAIPDENRRAPVSFFDFPGSVLWADLSASQELLGNLRPGVVNLYRCQKPPSMRPVLPGETGPTIDNTEYGVAGRDRE